MNSKIYYLLELTKLIGRLGYCLSANDSVAYVNILESIKTLTEQSISANKPRMQMRIRELPFEDEDDDQL